MDSFLGAGQEALQVCELLCLSASCYSSPSVFIPLLEPAKPAAHIPTPALTHPAGRRPAFGINTVTSLGHMALTQLAGEAVGSAAAAGVLPPPGAVPAATVLAKSLVAIALLSQGTPLVTQASHTRG